MPCWIEPACEQERDASPPLLSCPWPRKPTLSLNGLKTWRRIVTTLPLRRNQPPQVILPGLGDASSHDPRREVSKGEKNEKQQVDGIICRYAGCAKPRWSSVRRMD